MSPSIVSGRVVATTISSSLPIDLVRELEELAVGALFVLDLEIAEHRAAIDAPVDEPRLAVDEPLFVQAHERLGDRDGPCRGPS